MEKTISRQFIIVIRIIITISVVHFPNELNQNRSQYPNWSCDYKLPELSFTLNLLPAFHTICYSLVPLNQLLFLACANSNFWSSPKNSKICLSLSLSLFSLSLSLSLSCVTSIYTWPIRSYLKQTNLNLLCKHCKLVLNTVTFCRRALFAIQTNQYQIMLCHSTATNHCSIFFLS